MTSETKDTKDTKYRLVATDLDGTLLDHHHKITDRNAKIIQLLAANGIHVVLISGRMTSCMVDYENRLGIDMNMVCYNGAAAIGRKKDGRPILFHRPLPKNTMKIAIDFCNKMDLVLNVYAPDGKLYARCNTEEHMNLTIRYKRLTNCEFVYVKDYEIFRETEPFKLLILTNDVYSMHDLVVAQIPNIKQIAHLIRGEFFLEILHPKANKEVALVELCKNMGIKMEEVVAFGDGENDKEFLAATGLGIAMKNATDITKQRAKKVSVYTNNEDAVSRELETLLESNRFALITANITTQTPTK